MTTPAPALYTPDEVAALLRVHRSTVYRHADAAVADGRAVRLGRAVRYLAAPLLDDLALTPEAAAAILAA